jgi:hypothetical protein
LTRKTLPRRFSIAPFKQGERRTGMRGGKSGFPT